MTEQNLPEKKKIKVLRVFFILLFLYLTINLTIETKHQTQHHIIQLIGNQNALLKQQLQVTLLAASIIILLLLLKQNKHAYTIIILFLLANAGGELLWSHMINQQPDKLTKIVGKIISTESGRPTPETNTNYYLLAFYATILYKLIMYAVFISLAWWMQQKTIIKHSTPTESPKRFSRG